MQINVRFLENLKLEASFDDFKIIADQPVRYKGDGQAPGPFDYFLASSALCAAYFVKVYCAARNIPTDDIKISQNNIVDPDNRYNQTFRIEAQLPPSITDKDRAGIIAAMERCAVKRVIQNSPGFEIEALDSLSSEAGLLFDADTNSVTNILGKDAPLEETIKKMSGLLSDLGIKIEIASWRNQVPHVWSVHIRDADSPLCYTNGKGASQNASLASALGEYLERISNNYFYNDYFLGEEIAGAEFVHYPDEKWFKVPEDDSLPEGLMDETMLRAYSNDGELRASHLIDTNSGAIERGICALPFVRQSDQETVYAPVNLIGNLFVSNGMSAGNTKLEARVQCLSEIFERAVKNKVIKEEIALPNIPKEVISSFPKIQEGIDKLEEAGFPIYVKDASLGGKYPVALVALMNPKNGGVFASFGAHPKFEVALERSLTELLQGRSFEGMKDTFAPTFNQYAVTEHNNIVDHFIDSTGVVSWKLFSETPDYEFSRWDLDGDTEKEHDHLLALLKDLGKEVYIADYKDLGAHACRILVPEYSEIYLPEDLIWDNNNRALEFRGPILNIHRLEDAQLTELIESLEDSELDDYMPISELIGVAFDETTPWGQATIGELKGLIYLALGNLENAKGPIENLVAFSDVDLERKKFFQALNIAIDIEVGPDLNWKDYQSPLVRMYGKELIEIVKESSQGKRKFHGLVETDMNLKNIDRHQKLLESYRKLMKARLGSLTDA